MQSVSPVEYWQANGMETINTFILRLYKLGMTNCHFSSQSVIQEDTHEESLKCLVMIDFNGHKVERMVLTEFMHDEPRDTAHITLQIVRLAIFHLVLATSEGYP